VLVLRPALDVLVVRCDRGTCALAHGLRQGLPLADCLAAAAGDDDFDLSVSLAFLLAQGALASEPSPLEIAA